jgi:hypothetical protein
MQTVIKNLHPFAYINIIDRVRKCWGYLSFDFTQDVSLSNHVVADAMR